MSASVSNRMGKLERTVRAQGRQDFIIAVDADFAPALALAAANDPVRKQIEAARRDFIKGGTAAAERQALEAFLAERAPEPAPAPLVSLDALRSPVTVKIAANGERLPDDATEFVAVLLPQFDLLYTAQTQKASNWKQALEMGAAVDLFDGKGEWQLMDDVEAQLIIDRSKTGPAVLDAFASCTPTDDIYWTRRPLASSPSGGALCVSMDGGSVNWCSQNGRGRVRACRRVRASQF